MPIPRTYLTVSLTLSGYAILHLPTHSVVCDNLDRACELSQGFPGPIFLTVDEVFSEPWFYMYDVEWYEIKGERA